MTGQQPGLRIVPPDEARKIVNEDVVERRNPLTVALAHTAAVLGEQRDAVLAYLADKCLDDCEEGDCRQQYVQRDWCPRCRVMEMLGAE